MRVTRPAIERFMDKVSPEPNTGCWLWLGTRDKYGYGFFRRNGRLTRAHRAAFELFVGPIPDGMHVLHACDVPSCVCPDHLSVGTHADNMADMYRKGRNPLSLIGHPQTAETRRKLSISHTGKILSAETKALLSAALSGRRYPNRKRPPEVSPYTREKLSVAHKGRKKSAETRARMVEAWKVRKAQATQTNA